MKQVVAWLLAGCLFWVGGAARAVEIEGPPACKQCGMDRTTFAQSRVLLTYDDGATSGLCSIHCAAIDIKQHPGHKVTSFQVADYGTKALIDARKAVWVVGGQLPGVMTETPKWAFAQEADAQAFVAQHGGRIVGFSQAMAEAQQEADSGQAPHCACQGPGGLMTFNPAFGDDIYHTHPAGMWMFNYRYMRMDMDGLRDGTSDVAASSVGNGRGLPYDNIMMIPTKMTMDMHMLMAMYGVNDKLTLMGMLNYVENKMDMLMDMSPRDKKGNLRGATDMGAVPDEPMKSSGLGDTELRAIYKLSGVLNGSLGLSLPTGDIDQNYTTMGTVWRMPYDMQLGSGTFDLKPALTYSQLSDDSLWNWGGQAMFTLRTGKNSNNYSLGNSVKLNTWLQRALGPAAAWLRLAYSDTERISGYDPEVQKALDNYNSMMWMTHYMAATMPDSDPNNYGGQRLDGFIGLSVPVGGMVSLGVEGGVPLYQNLNGLQMKNDWYCTVGLQAMF
ncbi:MAG: nitrous oxide reductase accessory protein NosL [Desulfobacteraceae bacterium]|nr:nitrous oxide reductase accessory protein NosL [Desulfobacteraceae bacterium]